MPVTLFRLYDFPDRIAISKIGELVGNRVFFLDFSRPLEKHRKFGLTVGLFVPVIHRWERMGGYVVGVGRGDPYYPDIQVLWKQHFPAEPTPLDIETDPLKIIADFARQFPEDVN